MLPGRGERTWSWSIIDIKSDAPYGALMRTTLTIDEDVAARIEERRKREGQSLKQVVNLLLREGLRCEGRNRTKAYRTRPHTLGLRPGFDAARLNQLVDELETEERVENEARLRALRPAR